MKFILTMILFQLSFVVGCKPQAESSEVNFIELGTSGLTGQIDSGITMCVPRMSVEIANQMDCVLAAEKAAKLNRTNQDRAIQMKGAICSWAIVVNNAAKVELKTGGRCHGSIVYDEQGYGGQGGRAYTNLGKNPEIHVPSDATTHYGSMATLVHEAGHAFGLGDTYEGSGGSVKAGHPANSSMATANYTRPQEDDIEGIKSVYKRVGGQGVGPIYQNGNENRKNDKDDRTKKNDSKKNDNTRSKGDEGDDDDDDDDDNSENKKDRDNDGKSKKNIRNNQRESEQYAQYGPFQNFINSILIGQRGVTYLYFRLLYAGRNANNFDQVRFFAQLPPGVILIPPLQRVEYCLTIPPARCTPQGPWQIASPVSGTPFGNGYVSQVFSYGSPYLVNRQPNVVFRMIR